MKPDDDCFDLGAVYRGVAACDPRLNPTLTTREYLVRAQQRIDLILSVVVKDSPTPAYIVAHARDVRRQIDKHRELLKQSWTVELPAGPEGEADAGCTD